MNIDRYLLIKGIQISENVFIPVWDDSIEIEEDVHDTSMVYVTANYDKEKVVDCIYDITTKSILHTIVLDYYSNKLEFEIGEEVLIEKSYNTYAVTTIKDIIYRDYSVEAIKGSNIKQFYLDYFTDIVINPDRFYSIKSWLPYYVIENGHVIRKEHELKHKAAL